VLYVARTGSPGLLSAVSSSGPVDEAATAVQNEDGEDNDTAADKDEESIFIGFNPRWFFGKNGAAVNRVRIMVAEVVLYCTHTYSTHDRALGNATTDALVGQGRARCD